MFIATLNEYNGSNAKEDKSGNMPIILNVLSGKCPNKRMISYGWAVTQGMELGKSYLIDPIETEEHAVHGRQFQFNKVKEVSALEIMENAEKFPAKIYDVTTKSTVHENNFSGHNQQ